MTKLSVSWQQFLKSARRPENVQAFVQQGVAKTHEFYTKSAATARESAKVLTSGRDRLGKHEDAQ